MSKSWGTPTWYLFHSLAEHIDEEFYKNNADEVCNLIKNICSNLPCEDCRTHAVQYTKTTLQKRYVPTKNALRQYLFDFHNSVNIRTRKPKFTDYDMYKRARLKPIIDNFAGIFALNANPVRGFHDQMARKWCIKKLYEFMNSYNKYFVWK